MNDFAEFQCPYCGETLSIAVDLSGGTKQYFVYDCEVCCRPIEIELEASNGSFVSLIAKTTLSKFYKTKE